MAALTLRCHSGNKRTPFLLLPVRTEITTATLQRRRPTARVPSVSADQADAGNSKTLLPVQGSRAAWMMNRRDGAPLILQVAPLLFRTSISWPSLPLSFSFFFFWSGVNESIHGMTLKSYMVKPGLNLNSYLAACFTATFQLLEFWVNISSSWK